MASPKNIKYHPDLVWLRPYVEAGLKYVPKRSRINRIHAVKPLKHKCLGFFGKLEEGDKGLCLSLYTHYWHYVSWYPKKRKIEPFSKIDLLQTLAHELAHCTHWDHTPEHKKLENKICNLFMRMLAQNGYESEEIELKALRSNNKPQSH